MQGLVYCNVDPVCGNSGLQFFMWDMIRKGQ